MSESERSLLDAVLDHPDDDLPRLVYADYLDEQGDAKRAQFIRMQISIAAFIEDDQLDSPEYANAVKYSVSMLPEDFIPWIEANQFCLTDAANPYVSFDKDTIQFRISNSYVTLQYRRGFLTAVNAPANWVLLNFVKLLEHPIERIQFRDDPFFRHGELLIHFVQSEWSSELSFGFMSCPPKNWGSKRSELSSIPVWLTQIWANHPLYRARIRELTPRENRR